MTTMSANYRKIWRHAARGGALTGIAVVFGYAYAFAAGATLWTSLRLWAGVGSGPWLFDLLILNAAQWVIPIAILGGLAGMLALLVGSGTGILLGLLAVRLNLTHSPLKAAIIGLILCLAIAGTFHAVFGLGFAIARPSLFAQLWLFGLALPSALYVVAGGIGGWLLNRQLGEAGA